MTKSEHHFGSQVEHHLCTSERLLGTPNLAGSGNILHDPASRHSAVTLERSKHVHKGTLMRYNQEGQSLYLVTGLPEGPGRNQQFELRPGGRNELSVRTTRGGRKSFILRTCMRPPVAPNRQCTEQHNEQRRAERARNVSAKES